MAKRKNQILLAAILALLAAIGFALYLSLSQQENQEEEKIGFHGVRNIMDGFSHEEQSPDGKVTISVEAKKYYQRDRRVLKVARFSGDRENVLQEAAVKLSRQGVQILSATSSQGVFYPKSGSVRLYKGVEIKIGDLSVTCGMAEIKKDGQISIKGDYEIKNGGGKSAKGKIYNGRPEELKMP